MVDKKYVAITVIAVFVIIGIASASLVLSGTSKTPVTGNNDMKMSNDDSNSGSVSQATVIIQNGTFNPSKLAVKAGTTVTWISKDSNNQYMVTGSGFMSPHLTSGQSFNYTFSKPGTYDYYDMDHMDNKNLTGTVIVH